ncbi:MAG: zinc-ribbon domain-containing protein [Ruminococcus sp.]|nr:zinc-ribbon domain-containing protein [Ruminococcus sp.]MCD7800186.1 zinc-ribbon domain-containing protein [Ruminococcus sp.]
MYEDKILVCKDCGSEFTFTAGEQEFFAEKGFTNEPQRCKSCRMARKNGNSANKPAVELFETTCSKCGGVAKVRFQPKEGRPVYCGKCFAEMKNNY